MQLTFFNIKISRKSSMLEQIIFFISVRIIILLPIKTRITCFNHSRLER